MFWRTETQVPQVAEVRSCNRWQAIRRNQRFCDNSTLRGSSKKRHKLRPFLNSLQRILKGVPVEEKVCVDEQLILLRGKHNLKVNM
jgi:hypothetical protein